MGRTGAGREDYGKGKKGRTSSGREGGKEDSKEGESEKRRKE